MRAVKWMQPVLVSDVNRDGRLLTAGATDLREIGGPGEPVNVGIHAMGRAFHTFREYRREHATNSDVKRLYR